MHATQLVLAGDNDRTLRCLPFFFSFFLASLLIPLSVAASLHLFDSVLTLFCAYPIAQGHMGGVQANSMHYKPWHYMETTVSGPFVIV